MKNASSRLIGVFAGLVAVGACASPRTVTEPVVYSQAEAADSVLIRVNQTIVVDGIRIRFNAVESDSRCATGVVCVWQGDATTTFLVSPNSDVSSALDPVQLHTGVEPRAGTAQHYRIELLAVLPYPKAGSSIKPEDYSAWIRAVRIE